MGEGEKMLEPEEVLRDETPRAQPSRTRHHPPGHERRFVTQHISPSARFQGLGQEG